MGLTGFCANCGHDINFHNVFDSGADGQLRLLSVCEFCDCVEYIEEYVDDDARL